MGLRHELGIQTDEALHMVQGLPAGLVDGVHDDLVKLGSVHAGLSLDAAGLGVASGYGAVVEQQNLRVLLQTDLLGAVHRHIGNDGSGRILGQLICFLQGVHLYYVVAVESALDDGACLAETGLAGADLRNGVIRFC